MKEVLQAKYAQRKHECRPLKEYMDGEVVMLVVMELWNASRRFGVEPFPRSGCQISDLNEHLVYKMDESSSAREGSRSDRGIDSL